MIFGEEVQSGHATEQLPDVSVDISINIDEYKDQKSSQCFHECVNFSLSRH